MTDTDGAFYLTYEFAVSNNGVNHGDDVTMYVYNSKCQVPAYGDTDDEIVDVLHNVRPKSLLRFTRILIIKKR